MYLVVTTSSQASNSTRLVVPTPVNGWFRVRMDTPFDGVPAISFDGKVAPLQTPQGVTSGGLMVTLNVGLSAFVSASAAPGTRASAAYDNIILRLTDRARPSRPGEDATLAVA